MDRVRRVWGFRVQGSKRFKGLGFKGLVDEGPKGPRVCGEAMDRGCGGVEGAGAVAGSVGACRFGCRG